MADRRRTYCWETLRTCCLHPPTLHGLLTDGMGTKPLEWKTQTTYG